MLSLTNLLHPTINPATLAARQWMFKNYQHHLADGSVDVEGLAEQAALEFDLDRMTAEDLASVVAVELDAIK